MRLWLVRHARPLIEDGICYGRLDVAADEHQTQVAARRVAEELPRGVELLSSPLRRCAQLARALTALRPDLAVRIDPRLAEMDFGAWEGRPWSAIDRHELDGWAEAFARYRPGGRGESATGFTARVGQLLDEARAQGAEQAWITHGGVFKAVLLRSRGVELKSASEWPAEALAWGDWRLFDCDHQMGGPGP